MLRKCFVAAVAITLGTLVASLAHPVAAVDAPSASLTGVVTSQEEGAMEGVLVGAKRGMNTDLVVRVDIKTGDVTEYLLPRATNIHRVNVDKGTNPPTFWVGTNLGASLIKVEPLE